MISIKGERKFFLIFLAGIGFLPGLSGAHGQGIFVPNRMHGFGVQMNGAASDAATGFGTILGISIKGRFDFGILIEKVNFHRKILDSNLSGFGIGPGVTIHLAKTNHISIAASVAYERLSFSGDIRRSNNESLHTNAVTAEVTFYHSPETSKSIRVIPAASVNFISTEFVEVSRSGGNRNRLSEFDETITLGFGLSIAVKRHLINLAKC